MDKRTVWGDVLFTFVVVFCLINLRFTVSDIKDTNRDIRHRLASVEYQAQATVDSLNSLDAVSKEEFKKALTDLGFVKIPAETTEEHWTKKNENTINIKSSAIDWSEPSTSYITAGGTYSV